MMSAARTRLRSEVPHLRRYARVLAQSPSDADRLVRRCLKRALATYDRRNPDQDLRIWLFQILHLSAGSSRQRKRSAHAESLAGGVFTARDASRYLEVVARALEHLSLEQREVAFLVAVERLTYEQTATVLGLSSRTVHTRISEAREAMSKSLQTLL